MTEAGTGPSADSKKKESFVPWIFASVPFGAFAGIFGGPGGQITSVALAATTSIGLEIFRKKDDAESKLGIWFMAGLIANPLIWIGFGIHRSMEVNAERERLHTTVEKIAQKKVNSSNFTLINTEVVKILHDACYSKTEESECLKLDNTQTLLDQPHRQMLSKVVSAINTEVDNEKERQRLEEARKAAEAEELRRQSIANGTYQPTEFEVGRPCKQIAEQNALTGRVDWGWFGAANSRWYPGSKTITLEGRSKNAFGVKIPFKISCQWQKGGIVKMIGLTH